ncbi:unnamed protein product [Tetraodon nigroviridis]|uniref:(spotted green pufferfish) hypothetical protein n=1 Tax=Tetraodon nigroviridis TaxID=99883 RepID=Q4RI98_TETNG|nr:unnamed protein product [Tetraodon nigroviridis]
MWIFLPVTCLLVFATTTLGFYEGTCLRKDPSPGVLVLTPGRELIMTCRGHVMIDGLKVRKGSNASKRGVVSKTEALIKSLKQDEEEEWNDESGLTQRENSSLQWKWTGRMVGKRDRGVKWSRGATLSLSSVTLADSGTFTCYDREKERFSIKVIVAEPPEKPDLFCYKKSPSSKIRCESKPQQNVTIRPNCYLLLRKSPSESFQPFQCSFSSRTSRCFCVLDHNEDEMRLSHFAVLCVTSITGNTTSNLINFTPLRILKPDPPANVSVRKVEEQEMWMKITWNLPSSWKSHDNFYDLIYQIKYRPAVSSFHFEQIHNVKDKRSFLITDAIPGEEYLIQVRTKEEYDGLWSNWSTAVYGCSWTGK